MRMEPLNDSRSSSLHDLRASSSTIITNNISSEKGYPGWRTIFEQEGMKQDHLVSLFAHEIPKNDDNKDEKATNDEKVQYHNAEWSEDAYNAAIEQYDRFISCTDAYIAPYIQDALRILDHAYRLYGPESVICSFNGGKDAAVILELIRAAHANHYRTIAKQKIESNRIDNDRGEGGSLVGTGYSSEVIRPRTIYFNERLEFPEVFKFVQQAVDIYDLDMLAFQEGIGFVRGLKMLVENNYQVLIPSSSYIGKASQPHAIAFVLGTRKADPNAGKQDSFAPSSSYMPPFMRVNPILQWSYGHVWHFLRFYKLPYCSLYDKGYTSLGTVEDTLPCPALKKVQLTNTKDYSKNYSNYAYDRKADEEFWPAYMLKDWKMERSGRVKRDKKEKNYIDKQIKSDDDAISGCSTNISLPKEIDPLPKLVDVRTKEESNIPLDVTVNSDLGTSLSIGSTQRVVGLITIGDEILKGLTPDTNTHAAVTALNAKGVPLARVALVSDNQDDIIAEIEQMKDSVDVIITSGGVGPTHDDVTIKSVADALGSELVLNQEMINLLRSKMDILNDSSDELSEAQIKMATLPKCAKLKNLSGKEGDWPVLQCQNIFILPGIPQYFEKKVELVASYLSTELVRNVAFKVVLSIDENSIVPLLNDVVETHPNVSFGSYPFVDHPEAKTVVTLEGKAGSFERTEFDINVKVALSDLVNRLPDGSVLRVDDNNDLSFV